MGLRSRTTWVAVLVVTLVVGCGFLVLSRITTAAFDRLEAGQIAQDADRVRIALDDQLALLANYGQTNSIWDVTFDAVAGGDQGALVENLPPAITREAGVDGVLGVGPDGAPRIGGLIDGTDTYRPPTGPLADPAVLRTLVPATTSSEGSVCGAIAGGDTDFLYCGFPALPTSGEGDPAGGLIWLRALDTPRLAALSEHIGLGLRLVDRPQDGGTPQPALHGALGDISVLTTTLGADRTAVDLTIPAHDGASLVVEAFRERPIHRTASSTIGQTAALMGVSGLLLLVVVLGLVRRATNQQVRPLRATAEQI